MGVDERLVATMRAQSGLVTRAQARAAGMTDTQVAYRLRTGMWQRVEQGVFRHAIAELGWKGEVMRAQLGTGGLVSHRSSGLIWGVYESRAAPVEVTVAKGRHVARDYVRIHESTQIDLADPTVVDGFLCTGLARTVLDLAGVLGQRELNQVVDTVLRSTELEWPQLYRVLARHSRQGRNGCGKLRQLLDQRYGEKVVPDSSWNRWVAELLSDAGLPAPVMEHTIHDRRGFVARVDLAYPDRRIAIELDSVRWHHNLEAFEADRRKRNRLVNAGWRVLSFTWTDYRDTPERLCALVADSVRAGG